MDKEQVEFIYQEARKQVIEDFIRMIPVIFLWIVFFEGFYHLIKDLYSVFQYFYVIHFLRH